MHYSDRIIISKHDHSKSLDISLSTSIKNVPNLKIKIVVTCKELHEMLIKITA